MENRFAIIIWHPCIKKVQAYRETKNSTYDLKEDDNGRMRQ